MENQLNGLQIPQAYESASKNRESQMKEEHKEGAIRFKMMAVGCFFYALFYTFCLYKNKSGITYPFFVGGTLYFFGYYFKKYGATAAKDRKFLVGAMLVVGILNCTTDSSVLIFLNQMLVVFLAGVLILESYHDSLCWRLGTWGKALMHLFFGSILQFYKPFEDVYWNRKLFAKHKEVSSEVQERKKRMKYGILGVGLSIPVLFVIVILLGSADVLFYKLICDICDTFFSWDLPEFLTGGDFVGIIWMLGCSFIGIYAVLTYSSKRCYIENAVKAIVIEWDSFVAITFLCMITLVYILFCGIQIFGLFLGWMELPERYTYAEYARQGFFQLLFVCIFNICLVLFVSAFFKRNKGLQGLLTVISLCTYIMIVSSAYRMILYICKYQLTFLRVFVLWALLMIALLLAGVIIYIWKQKFGLFRFMLSTVVIGYLAFATIHPDYWIASYNISQFEQGDNIDLWYLTRNLSADAALPLCELESSDRAQTKKWEVENGLEKYEERLLDKVKDMHVRNWNFSRGIAKYLWNIE